MDFREIKGTKHYLYDDEKEFHIERANAPVRHNWRHGEEGEWVYTDDGYVCQILRKFTVKDPGGKERPCVRTVCGSFVSSRLDREMLGEDGIAENIYTFSGTNAALKNHKDRNYNSKELMFGRFASSGMGALKAYKLVYPEASSDKYIKERCERLLKTETIKNMIDKKIQELLNEEGATPNYLIERYKTIADLAESDTAKLRALDSLARISGLFDSVNSKSEQVTIWTGWTPEQLEGVKNNGKSELIAHAEKNEND